MLPRLALTFALAAILCPVHARAQAQPQGEVPAQTPAQFDAPAYIAIVDGSATLERDGRIETSPLNMPLLTGDRIRTTDGRVEIRFADGGRLLLDSATAVDVLADDLVRLTAGRLRLSVVRARQVSYRIDSPAGSVRVLEAGEYRVALIHGPAGPPAAGAEDTQLEFAVAIGSGEISTLQGVTAVRAGERAYASAGLLPSYTYAYNSAEGDAFDQWADMQRGTVYEASSASAQYLPQDMTSYASTFDHYGDWRSQQSYGYVWYPRVAADWHPYYYGRWASYPSYGYTWITSEPFGYPTHHYGRWGVSAGLWFWIPAAAWGPAYVSWAYAPDYVSWCPLGWNNSAVFSIGYYNVGPSYYSSRYHGHYYSAWTTVRHSDFGRGYSAHQHAVNFDRGYAGARPHFTEGRVPAGPSYASARATAVAPIRNAGTRGAAPRYVNRGSEIVRSQTARPLPPRDAPGTRRAPAQTYAPGASAQQRSSPLAQGAGGAVAARPPRAWDNPSYRPPNYSPAPARTAPAYSAPAYGAPSYSRPSYSAPAYSGANRAYERAMPRAGTQPSPPRYDPAPRPQGNGPARPAAPAGNEHATPRSSGGGGHVDTRAPAGAGVAHSRGRGR